MDLSKKEKEIIKKNCKDAEDRVLKRIKKRMYELNEETKCI